MIFNLLPNQPAVNTPPPVVYMQELPSSSQQPLFPESIVQAIYDGLQPERPPVIKREDPPPGMLGPQEPQFHIPQGFPLRLLQSAYQETMQVLALQAPEFAGMLMGPKEDATLVTHVVWDEQGTGTPAMFHLNGKFLNKKIKLFRLVGMECKGFVHSHPHYVTRPSQGDIRYVLGLFGNPKNSGGHFVYMPIFCADRLFPYVIDRHGRVIVADLILV